MFSKKRLISFLLVIVFMALQCIAVSAVVTPDSFSMTAIGNIKPPVAGLNAREVLSNGNILYVLWGDNGGLSVYNTSNLATNESGNNVPTLLHNYDEANKYYNFKPAGRTGDNIMLIHNDRLYCFDWNTTAFGVAANWGIIVYDIAGAKASSPEYLGRYGRSDVNNFSNMKFIGDDLYVFAVQGIFKIDTTIAPYNHFLNDGDTSGYKNNSTAISLVVSVADLTTTTNQPMGFEIQGDYAFVLAGGIGNAGFFRVYKISTDTKIYDKSLAVGGVSLRRVGNFVYFPIYSSTLGISKIVGVNVTNPEAITDASLVDAFCEVAAPNIKAMATTYVKGRHLFVGFSNLQIAVLDTVNPMNLDVIYPYTPAVSGIGSKDIYVNDDNQIFYCSNKTGLTDIAVYIYKYNLTSNEYNIYEAENMAKGTGAAYTSNTTYSGTGYINLGLVSGAIDPNAWLSTDFYSLSAGTKDFYLSYRHGESGKTAKINVSVNDVSVADVDLTYSSINSPYESEKVTLPLIAGKNVIKLTRKASGGTESAYVFIDGIKFSKGYTTTKANDDIVTSGIIVTNTQSGQSIIGLPVAGTKTRLALDILKQKDTADTSAMVIFACYTDGEELLECKVVPEPLSIQNQWDKVTMSAEMTIPDNTAEIRAFVWNSPESLIPLVPNVKLP